MAKRRSKSAPSPPKQPTQGRRAEKKPPVEQKKPSQSATETESLREEAERGWAKLDRQIARRQQRDVARAVQRAKSKVLQRPNPVKEVGERVAD